MIPFILLERRACAKNNEVPVLRLYASAAALAFRVPLHPGLKGKDSISF